jgi:hypothetical protein
MNDFRAILVVMIALSVAALPMANPMGASTIVHGKSLDTSNSVSHSDCCPHGKHCESKRMKDCGSMPGCALKCFNLTADTGPGVVVKLPPVTEIEFAHASQSLGTHTAAPALPPPRV